MRFDFEVPDSDLQMAIRIDLGKALSPNSYKSNPVREKVAEIVALRAKDLVSVAEIDALIRARVNAVIEDVVDEVVRGQLRRIIRQGVAIELDRRQASLTQPRSEQETKG